MKDKIIANRLLRYARNDDVDLGIRTGFLRLRCKKPVPFPQNDRHCDLAFGERSNLHRKIKAVK